MLAINPASLESHRKYADKKGFKFPILSDVDRKVKNLFYAVKDDGKGVWRTVYAVDPKGKIIFAERGQASYQTIMEVIKEHS